MKASLNTLGRGVLSGTRGEYMRSTIVLLLVCFVASVELAAGQQLRAVTEQFPPYSFERDGEIGGLPVEIVRELHRVAEMEVEIDVLSWRRAYRQARRRENVLLFSVGRTPDREDHFQWIGPIVPYVVSFYGYGDRAPTVRTWSELRNYRIGVVQGDMRDQYLSDAGGFRIVRFRNSQGLLRALAAGEIDLAPVVDLNLPYFLAHLELDATEFSHVYTSPELSHDGLYLVAGPRTSRAIVRRLNRPRQDVRESKFIDQLYREYASPP